MVNKILAIGAHIDDVELAMGGTLIKHKDRGDEITIAITKADEDRTGSIYTREKEQKESGFFLKADIIFMRGDDSMESKVEALDKIDPTILYFPYEADTHQDHVIAAQIGLAVSRRNKFTVLKYIGTTSHSYSPNYLEVIDIERKKKLVSLFFSQMDRRPKFMEIMEAQNRFFGSLIPGNGHYAEGFVLHRIIRR